MSLVLAIKNLTTPGSDTVLNIKDTYLLTLIGAPANTAFDLNTDGVYANAYGVTNQNGVFQAVLTFPDTYGGGSHSLFVRCPTLVGALSNTVTFDVTPFLQIENLTHPNDAPMFDYLDQYKLTIIGLKASQPFDLNVDNGYSLAFGTADANGKFTQTGTFVDGFLGNHSEFVRTPTATGLLSNTITFCVTKNISYPAGLQLSLHNLTEVERNPEFGASDQYLLEVSGATPLATVNLLVNNTWSLGFGTVDANGFFRYIGNFVNPRDVEIRNFTEIVHIADGVSGGQRSNVLTFRVIDSSSSRPTQMVGQDLITLTKANLLGYGNVANTAKLMGYINEGKDEIWSIIKNLVDDYFLTRTQSKERDQLNFFPKLIATARDYALPTDFREMRFIECTTPGFEDLTFRMLKIDDPDWRALRRGANSQRTADGSNVGPMPRPNYHYIVTGKNTLTFAEYLEQELDVTIWYIRGLVDLEPDTPVPDIVMPYSRKIADYAAKKAILGTADAKQWDAWSKQWRDDITMIAQGASPRNQADPEFVQDFEG